MDKIEEATIKLLELEVPGIVSPTNFKLDDPLKNKARLKALKKKPAKKIATLTLRMGEQLPLLRTGDAQGSIYLEYKDELGVFIQYHTYQYNFLPVRSITQTKLWKSKKLPVSNMFSPNLFFKVMLKQTGAVLSDIEHTPDGEDFWKRRLGEALTKKFNVALVDFGAQSYKQIRSKKELESLLDVTWGGGLKLEQFRQKRWMVWRL